MDHWFQIPQGLDPADVAALPMALETAYRSLAQLDLAAADTLLIHGLTGRVTALSDGPSGC